MSLNIKNSEAHRLVRQLSQLTGETLAATVTESLRERLDRKRNSETPLSARLLAIGNDCAQRLPEPWLSWTMANFSMGKTGSHDDHRNLRRDRNAKK